MGDNMREKIKVKNDFIFKKIFGDQNNSEILKSLLEAILHKKIDKLEIMKDFRLEQDNIDDKLGILDIKAVFNDNEKVNIEIQLINQYNMIKRTLFYLSKLYNESLKSGSDYSKLNKTITINLLDFNYINDIDKYHTIYHFREDEYNSYRLTDILEIHFIEFPKFKKKKANITDDLESWLLFIENPTQEVVLMLKDNKEIQKAKSVLEYLEKDEEAMRLYELREKAIHDYVTNIKGAKEEGIQIGIEKGMLIGKEEGREEGKQEEKLIVAKNLLEQKVDIKIIKAVTGLSEEVINNLI